MNHRGRRRSRVDEEPFELVEPLGAGGFARTYKARVIDPRLAAEWNTETVALKIPNSKELELALIKELMVGTVVKEALREVAGSANVVRYLGIERFQDDYVAVMEFVPDGNLEDLVGEPGRQRRLPVDEAVELTKGILSGLAVIHQVGVFHRDIKPANVLLDGDIPKIADLGISRILRTQQVARTTIGTMAYMSPETFSTAGASFASDIWSVGVVLYEMLTGSWPFGDAYTPSGPMMQLICNAEPVPPSQRCADVPPWLDGVVLKALQKDPSDRYAGPEEMHRLLITKDEVGDRLAELRPLMLAPDAGHSAEAALLALAREFPHDARVFQYLGEAHNRSFRHSEAVAAFEKAIALDQENPVLHWDLALALQKVGKTRRAAASLERAISLGLDPGLQRHAKHLLHVLREGLV
jgi:serine/threonine protein kinase